MRQLTECLALHGDFWGSVGIGVSFLGNGYLLWSILAFCCLKLTKVCGTKREDSRSSSNI